MDVDNADIDMGVTTDGMGTVILDVWVKMIDAGAVAIWHGTIAIEIHHIARNRSSTAQPEGSIFMDRYKSTKDKTLYCYA